MKLNKRIIILVNLFPIFLLFSSCSDFVESYIDSHIDNRQEIYGKGFILKSGMEFTLVTDEGLQYMPVNLSDEFKIDKLRVEFRGLLSEKPNQHGFYEIELKSIKNIS